MTTGVSLWGRSVAVPDRLSDHHDHPKFTVDHLGKQI
jgi:hypothetical protein